MSNGRPTFTSPFSLPNLSNPPPSSPSFSTRTPAVSTPLSAGLAGRKRSRDEAAPNLEDDYFPTTQPLTPVPIENEEDWEYGEGMTLIKPNRGGYIIEAGSQTGTWADEKAALASQDSSSPERPPLRAAKSQRLTLTSTPVIAEEVMSNGTLTAPVEAESNGGPTVDDFTRHLGIGWSLISADVDIQAAARGWMKYINNHFPVTDAKIRLQSKGLESYLVETNEGYFLFSENLKQGRLVSVTVEKTLENLRGLPPVFDGEVIMEAGETPKVNGVLVENGIGTEMIMTGTEGNVFFNGANGTIGMNGGSRTNAGNGTKIDTLFEGQDGNSGMNNGNGVNAVNGTNGESHADAMDMS